MYNPEYIHYDPNKLNSSQLSPAAFSFAPTKKSFSAAKKDWWASYWRSRKKHSTFILFCDKTNKLAAAKWRTAQEG